MTSIPRLSAVVAGLCLLAAVAAADILELRDGTMIDGLYLGGSQNSIRFEAEGQIQVFAVNDVLALTFTQTAPSAAAPAERPAAAAPAERPAATAPAERPAAPAPAPVTVPAGTPLLVRMAENLDSRTQKAGYKFTASLEGDLVADGTVVAEHGSRIYGQLTEAKRSRRMTGQSEFGIALISIMVNNQLRPIASSEVKAVSEDTGRSTVGRTARWAAVGGLIDGSDGAKTGAKAALGVSLLTSGQQVYIPRGTLLEFRVAQPFQP